jgi:hypothetical protein
MGFCCIRDLWTNSNNTNVFFRISNWSKFSAAYYTPRIFLILFLLIAINPLRYRLMMIPAIIEKFAYGSAVILLFVQERIAVMLLSAAIIDSVLGLLFVIAFFKTKEEKLEVLEENSLPITAEEDKNIS